LAALVALCFAGAASSHPVVAQRPKPRSVPRKKVAVKVPRIDYSKFSHTTHVVNEKLACASCHKFPAKNWKEVRTGDAAFPDVSEFPEHSSCLTCHRQQFFARERPAPLICSNCHVAVSPRDTTRYLFPSLGDITDPAKKRRTLTSEFGVAFPHDKHLDVVGFNEAGRDLKALFVNASFQEKKPAGPPKSCPVCHETYQPQGSSSEEYLTPPPKTLGDAFWLKKGTFKTVPNNHAVCFTCHNADSGIAPEPKDCQACHQLRPSVAALNVDFDPKLIEMMKVSDPFIQSHWSQRVSAGAFRHEGGAHPDLSCLACHKVETINTLDSKTWKVPVQSCGGQDGCHITATADGGGILNFEIDQKKKDPAFACTKCHVSFGRAGVPANHLQAITALAAPPKK
jgi:Cytochrome c7 and related cytochrome c